MYDIAKRLYCEDIEELLDPIKWHASLQSPHFQTIFTDKEEEEDYLAEIFAEYDEVFSPTKTQKNTENEKKGKIEKKEKKEKKVKFESPTTKTNGKKEITKPKEKAQPKTYKEISKLITKGKTLDNITDKILKKSLNCCEDGSVNGMKLIVHFHHSSRGIYVPTWRYLKIISCLFTYNMLVFRKNFTVS